MGREIERKFLVLGDSWRPGPDRVRLRQGYLSTNRDRTVRVRVAGGKAWITVKGRSRGAERAEYEYPIPVKEAEEVLEGICLSPLIEKIRHRIEYRGKIWEVDVFEGENTGLVLAEVELDDEAEEVELPPWAGEEVTGDSRYENASLVSSPYRQWSR